MKITSLSAQVKNPDRVNVGVDGKYSFSLEISQVIELGIKVGKSISETELDNYKKASDYGKIYFRALTYVLIRPHSVRELELYLKKKNIDEDVIRSISEKLISKNYLNDHKFASWWVENRNLKKGASRLKLKQELMTKGVSPEIISSVIQDTLREEKDEILKIIKRKFNRYDTDKLRAYLMRQGFRYSDINDAIENYDSKDSD
jgi:regulatory protein